MKIVAILWKREAKMEKFQTKGQDILDIGVLLKDTCPPKSKHNGNEENKLIISL